jgi:hypothetical protein
VHAPPPLSMRDLTRGEAPRAPSVAFCIVRLLQRPRTQEQRAPCLRRTAASRGGLVRASAHGARVREHPRRMASYSLGWVSGWARTARVGRIQLQAHAARPFLSGYRYATRPVRRSGVRPVVGRYTLMTSVCNANQLNTTQLRKEGPHSRTRRSGTLGVSLSVFRRT